MTLSLLLLVLLQLERLCEITTSIFELALSSYGSTVVLHLAMSVIYPDGHSSVVSIVGINISELVYITYDSRDMPTLRNGKPLIRGDPSLSLESHV
jgi:hypothetical protein